MNERDKAEGRIEAARLSMSIWRDKLQVPARAQSSVAKLLEESPDDAEGVGFVLDTPALEAGFRTRALGRAKQTLIAALAQNPVDVDRVELLSRVAAAGDDAALRQATLGALVALGRGSAGATDELRRLDARTPARPQIVLDDRALAEIADPEDGGPVAELFVAMAETITLALGPSLASSASRRRRRSIRVAVSRSASPSPSGSAPSAAPVISISTSAAAIHTARRASRASSRRSCSAPTSSLPLDATSRTAIAREVFALRRGISALRTRDENTVASVVVAACIEAGFNVPAPPYAVYAEVARSIKKEISRKTRKQIVEICQRIVQEQREARDWALAAQRSLDRMAAIAAGDVSLVLADLLGAPRERLGGLDREQRARAAPPRLRSVPQLSRRATARRSSAWESGEQRPRRPRARQRRGPRARRTRTRRRRASRCSTPTTPTTRPSSRRAGHRPAAASVRCSHATRRPCAARFRTPKRATRSSTCCSRTRSAGDDRPSEPTAPARRGRELRRAAPPRPGATPPRAGDGEVGRIRRPLAPRAPPPAGGFKEEHAVVHRRRRRRRRTTSRTSTTLEARGARDRRAGRRDEQGFDPRAHAHRARLRRRRGRGDAARQRRAPRRVGDARRVAPRGGARRSRQGRARPRVARRVGAPRDVGRGRPRARGRDRGARGRAELAAAAPSNPRSVRARSELDRRARGARGRGQERVDADGARSPRAARLGGRAHRARRRRSSAAAARARPAHPPVGSARAPPPARREPRRRRLRPRGRHAPEDALPRRRRTSRSLAGALGSLPRAPRPRAEDAPRRDAVRRAPPRARRVRGQPARERGERARRGRRAGHAVRRRRLARRRARGGPQGERDRRAAERLRALLDGSHGALAPSVARRSARSSSATPRPRRAPSRPSTATRSAPPTASR